MVSSSGKGVGWRQLLAREWQRLIMGFLCVAVLAAGLVVMASSAKAGWLTAFFEALKDNPLLFGGLLFLGVVGAVLPIVAAVIKIVSYERRNKKRTAQGN